MAVFTFTQCGSTQVSRDQVSFHFEMDADRLQIGDKKTLSKLKYATVANKYRYSQEALHPTRQEHRFAKMNACSFSSWNYYLYP